jgi:hypothetical protein
LDSGEPNRESLYSGPNDIDHDITDDNSDEYDHDNDVQQDQEQTRWTRQWNEEFQQLLEAPDSLAKFTELRNLLENFIFVSDSL